MVYFSHSKGREQQKQNAERSEQNQKANGWNPELLNIKNKVATYR